MRTITIDMLPSSAVFAVPNSVVYVIRAVRAGVVSLELHNVPV